MKRVSAIFLASLLGLAGCETDLDSTPARPDVDIDVKGTPDLDPRTDHDVDVDVGRDNDGRRANVDVDVSRDGNGPGVKVDVN